MQVISNRALLVIAAALGAILLAALVIKPLIDGDDDGASAPRAGRPMVAAPAPATRETRTDSTPGPARPESSGDSAQTLVAILPEAKRAFAARAGARTRLLKVTLDGTEGHIRFAYYTRGRSGAGLSYRPAGGLTAFGVTINGSGAFEVFALSQVYAAVPGRYLRDIQAGEPGFEPATIELGPLGSGNLLVWQFTDGARVWRGLADGQGGVKPVR